MGRVARPLTLLLIPLLAGTLGTAATWAQDTLIDPTEYPEFEPDDESEGTDREPETAAGGENGYIPGEESGEPGSPSLPPRDSRTPPGADLPPPPRPTGTTSLSSYALDVLNPLRYLDALIDWSVGEVNGLFSRVLTELESESVSGAVDENVQDRFELLLRYRYRFEELNNRDFADATYDRELRHFELLRLGAMAETANFRAEFEVHNACTTFSNMQEDQWDIYRASVLFFGFEGQPMKLVLPVLDVWIRLQAMVGRSPLTLGRGRLLGADDWPNLTPTWDTGLLCLQDSATGGAFTAWVARRVDYRWKHFNEWVRDTILVGAALIGLDPFNQIRTLEDMNDRVLLRHRSQPQDYDRSWFPVFNPREQRMSIGIDAYWLFHLVDARVIPSENGSALGREETHTVGVRGGVAWGKGVFTEAEFNYQFGKRGGDEVRSWALHAEAVLAAEWIIDVSFALKTDIASGDEDKSDGVQEQFDDLYPASHRFGAIALFAWSNLVRYGTELRLQVGDTTSLIGGIHLLRSLISKDAVYSPDAVLLPPAIGTGNELGFMAEARLRYQYSPRIVLTLGYAQFNPGSRFGPSGTTQTQSFLYFSADFRGLSSSQ